MLPRITGCTAVAATAAAGTAASLSGHDIQMLAPTHSDVRAMLHDAETCHASNGRRIEVNLSVTALLAAQARALGSYIPKK